MEECYGEENVSLVSVAFRWLNHHSAMTPECGGEEGGKRKEGREGGKKGGRKGGRGGGREGRTE